MMKLIFKNRHLNLATPAIMGILNVTPDSFFDGGKFTKKGALAMRVKKMISEGADIVDIGACSTRPGAKEVSEKEELKRLLPSIELVRKKFSATIISADTYRSNVAAEAVKAGADMINDVSGGGVWGLDSGVKDSQMFETIAKLNVPYVLMHSRGSPQTMQKDPRYKDVVNEVMQYFEERVEKLKSWKVGKLILDVGFGFGKTVEHNYALLSSLSQFEKFGYPILAGTSRKSMVNKVIGTKPETALNGTTVVNTIALMNGANILRVHDVKEAKEAVKIINFVKKGGQ